MAEPPKEGESFFRKVVRFVANPATDWADLNSRQDDQQALELEKSELKAMIERKRRNDFVRKREFDMLRRVRREGLSPEQLAALGGSSRLDDSEARNSDLAARPDGGVKAKIDEIEQQMVGDQYLPSAARRPPGFFEAPTEPAAFNPQSPRSPSGYGTLQSPTTPPPARAVASASGARTAHAAPAAAPIGEPPLRSPAPSPAPTGPSGMPGPAHAGAVMGPGLSPLSPLPPTVSPAAAPVAPPTLFDAAQDLGGGLEVSEVVHDPELDEAVIAFANADFDQCEQSLTTLTSRDGVRAQHAETWLVLFDLYRATGQQHKFDQLAAEYAQVFGWSPPQWFSLPRLVADAVADERPRRAGPRGGGEVGWVCPAVLDVDAVARLRSQSLQMPLPWVFDFAGLQTVETEAAAQLTELLRQWASQALDMRWLAGDRLFDVLQDAAPTGVRDADPAFWVLRLEALRLANRPDQFDETAIDFCVTYEVSPPSWERARCKVHLSGKGRNTHAPAMSQVSEVSTTFLESSIQDEPSASALPSQGGMRLASVELSGQLVGGIEDTLKRLDGELGTAALINVSCARLIRVDFIAAGDLLNWVLAKRNEGRHVGFSDSHRLVALFFGAMGINEHARVRVRRA